MHCAIRNKNAKRNNICLTNTEETLDEGRFLEQKLGKHECRHLTETKTSSGPDLTLDRNKNPGHCLQSQHFDEHLQSWIASLRRPAISHPASQPAGRPQTKPQLAGRPDATNQEPAIATVAPAEAKRQPASQPAWQPAGRPAGRRAKNQARRMK